jgi:DNA-binding CsgD family transcriptional regulator/tetratricopeptide (TPR) repeat protein
MIVRPVVCRQFIGRREEIAYLQERRLEAGSSHGGLVLISGDAGVGKSRLISEFLTSLARSRWRTFVGQCDAGAGRPFGPILDILGRIDGPGLAFGSATTKREQQRAILDRFAALAAHKGLVVAIEDVHWADAATLEMLAYFGRELGRMRILLLASFRSGDLHPDDHVTAAIAKIARESRAGRIDLAPLHGSELRAFIDEALDGLALAPETLREITLAGEGNPFFTEELLKSAVEANMTTRRESRRRNVPATIRTTVLERLQPFDEPERQIVMQAAVIGRTFGLDLLKTTLETDAGPVLRALRHARDCQLIEEVTPSHFRFRHGLTRDAIYDDFLQAERAPRHRAIAVALERAHPDDPPLAALAFHWWAAGDGERSPRYNELAGDDAARLHAHEDAIVCYERALESPDVEPLTRGSILEKMANHRAALDELVEARELYAAAAEIFGAASAYGREAACRSAAAILAYQTETANPTLPLETMLTRLHPQEYLARSRAHLGIAWVTATCWLPTKTAHHIAQVDERARAEAPDIRLRFHNVSAWVAMTVGDVDTFRREYAAWIDAARATGSDQSVSSVFCNGAMCFSFFGLHDEALEALEQGIRVARAARLVNSEEALNAVRVMIHLLRGDLARARAALETVPPSSESRFITTIGMAWGTIVAAHLDDRTLIERWFDGFEASVKPDSMLECGAGFAEILARRSRFADAAAFLHRAMPDGELVRGAVHTLLAVGRYGYPDDRARARDYLARAAAGRYTFPERPALALFDALANERAGRTSDAHSLAREAAEGFGRLQMPLLEAAALEISGDVAAALVLYRRAGATYEIRRLEGETIVAPELSPREREVAVLASQGLSNLDIAKRLTITDKTVEKHLASVYRKLRVSSRTRLAASFVEAQ